ncbi:hypothetical protein C1645_871661 [Glomus cerebriforme]|uniref:BTB/POZ domain-containing protein n=1 Tax=Glomus cerebriforme TaxID=658196 RepID=A0A397TFG1_9GLOM|nr:hypothetical protein C1645_871661 [Glomus cerebriforme]
MESVEILLNDFRQIYENSDDHDVVIDVGKGENNKSFNAHSVILRARCPYFRKDRGMTKYYLEHFSPETFEFILKYIYTGECIIKENVKKINVYQILVAANELGLTYLINYAQDYIITNEDDWTESNVIRMYKESVRCKSFTKLLDFFGELIAFQPFLLFKSSSFNSLDHDIILKFLDRNDINVDEVEIWNYIIKWGMAQRPRLNSNFSNWSNHDFDELQRRCKDLISKVKLFCITSSEYFMYVRPYKRILPSHIVNQLEEYYMVNGLRTSSYTFSTRTPRCYTINSRIISVEHLKRITDWITKKNYNNISILPLFSFKLLHRGRDDGLSVEEFHQNCDGKGPTLVIIKIKNSNDIIGGYNPFSWSSSGNWKVTDKSFIFSFRNGFFRNDILSRVRDQNTAIHDNLNHNVGFGYRDLLWFNGECVCSSYNRKIIESDGFDLEDFEVFQVVRKTNFS